MGVGGGQRLIDEYIVWTSSMGHCRPEPAGVVFTQGCNREFDRSGAPPRCPPASTDIAERRMLADIAQERVIDADSGFIDISKRYRESQVCKASIKHTWILGINIKSELQRYYQDIIS